MTSNYCRKWTLIVPPTGQATRSDARANRRHVHDFDMYVFLIPLEPRNMEDLGCEVEMVYGSGDEKEVHVLTKTGCFFVPKGVVHGPFTFAT